jgi:hypothetical protein
VDPVYEADALYRRYHRREEGPLQGAGVEIRRLRFRSRHAGCLLAEDRDIEENQRFDFPLFLPEETARHADVLVLLHGLNETVYTKLFPWAASLARLRCAPVAIFPMAFHLNRRPHSWIEEGRERYPERARIPGNAKASPLNAVLSRRIEAHPGRFFRAGLHTANDLADLARAARDGALGPLPPRTRLHFLGYSAGGYLALTLLLADTEGLFSQSRAVLFAAGAPAASGVRMDSLLILDATASRALRAFHEGEAPGADPEVERWLREHPLGRSFQRIFLGDDLARALAPLQGRLIALAGAADAVIPTSGMAAALPGVPLYTLDLGIHEAPFNVEWPLPGEYSATVGRRLLVEVARSADVAPRYRPAFAEFAGRIAAHA